MFQHSYPLTVVLAPLPHGSGSVQSMIVRWGSVLPRIRSSRDAVVVTGDYWSYSAVQRFAPELPSYSFARGAAWFGEPPEISGAVVFVGDPSPIASAFRTVTRVGELDNDVRVANLAQGTPIHVLDGRRVPRTQLWESARHL